MVKYVYDFVEGNKDLKDLLGGKGANLAEMTRLALPVPPGFTITTRACRAYLATGCVPDGLFAEVADHLRELEMGMDKRLGDPGDPLLVSVRSGAKFSMPGMMETVLNVGLNDTSVLGLAAHTGDERFAWDSYRRLIAMFGKTACGVPGEEFEAALDATKRMVGADNDTDLGVDALRDLVEVYKKVFHTHTGGDFPQAPHEQLYLAIPAVFQSWNAERAVVYRRQERIPADLGTAVNVMAMVYGNLGENSGTGVAFTRDPATGARGVYGDYLADAQGEDVVAGVRNTLPLQDLARSDRRSFDQLMTIMAKLESHYRDLCDIEFTVERGTLWMLQTRVGKRTPAAAFVIAGQLVDEGVIDLDEALRRVSGRQLTALMFPTFDLSGEHHPVATGVPASPGAAVGRAVFDAQRAAAATEPVILVRRETNPDDLSGMIAAQGILTSRGGKTSHAAVVARGMGKTCVCGADALDIDLDRRQLRVAGAVVHEGDLISIDGTTGNVYIGAVPVQPSPVVRYFEGTLQAGENPLVDAVHRLLTHADATRRLQVERLILATDSTERSAALAALLPMQRADFVDILQAMDGLPVIIRLIDPPLHEFLPSLEDLAVRVAHAEDSGMDPGRDGELLTAVRRMHESNPMLGLRGVRLGLVVPGLFAMQVRAVAEAAAQLRVSGDDPRPEIMVPLVGAVQELETVRVEIEQVLRSVTGAPAIPIGTMIEVPRAALTAGEIAGAADFFSFGTNDLTQMGWGFSRDDVEGAFFSRYLELGIFGVSPFESIDATGVGRLVRIAVEEGRAARPDLVVGVCGEHGGDPDSVHFFHDVGLDYVSCSPYRVPVARLEAGRAALMPLGTASDSR
jgi:pyruvate,orthophosphate dikinase